MVSLKEENYAPRRLKERPPPRDAEAKRVELRLLWTVLPQEVRQKTVRSLARLVVGHLKRREVRDEHS